MSNQPAHTTTQPPQTQLRQLKAQFTDDNRGVSVTIDTVLGIVILLTVSGILLTGLSDTANSRQEATTLQELDRVSEETTNALISADTLATRANSYQTRAGGAGTTAITVRYVPPDSVYGSSYTISVTSSDANTVTVTAQKDGISKSTTATLTATTPTGYAGGNQPLEITVESGEMTVEGVS